MLQRNKICIQFGLVSSTLKSGFSPELQNSGFFFVCADFFIRDNHPMSTRTPKARALQPADYLKKILTARVYDVAVESALEVAKNLSRRIHNTVLLKREDQQPVHSFKLRGAYNKMVQLTPAQLKKGVICASAGNHAQGVALGAKTLGTRAIIVMPTTTPSVKLLPFSSINVGLPPERKPVEAVRAVQLMNGAPKATGNAVEAQAATKAALAVAGTPAATQFAAVVLPGETRSHGSAMNAKFSEAVENKSPCVGARTDVAYAARKRTSSIGAYTP